jgi:hypothetical protein
MAEFGMYPVGGSAQTAMEAAVLVNAYRPFQLWTRRISPGADRRWNSG